MDDSETVIRLSTYADVLEAFSRDDVLAQASYAGAKPVVFDGVLVVLDGSEHHERRRKEMPLFRKLALSHYDLLIPQIVQQEIAAAADSEMITDLVNLSNSITGRFAAKLVGLDGLETKEDFTDFQQLVDTMKQAAMLDWLAVSPEEIQNRGRRAALEIRTRYFDVSLNHRKSLVNNIGTLRPEPSAPRDLISLLLSYGDEFDDDIIFRESMHYLLAAAGTSSASLVMAVDEMLNLADQTGSVGWDPEFLQTAVYEALRLYPPTLHQQRRATDALVLKSGLRIEPGNLVLLDITAANRDVNAYGHTADEFKPGRQVQPPAFPWGLSFGAGIHNCLGKHVAAGRQHAESPVMGVVTLALIGMFQAGIERASSHGGVLDTATLRREYLQYPVRFSSQQ